MEEGGEAATYEQLLVLDEQKVVVGLAPVRL